VSLRPASVLIGPRLSNGSVSLTAARRQPRPRSIHPPRISAAWSGGLYNQYYYGRFLRPQRLVHHRAWGVLGSRGNLQLVGGSM